MMMRQMRAWILLLVLAVMAVPAYAADQLVQTTPAATHLGNTDLSSTDKAWLKLINSAKSNILISQFYLTTKEAKQKTIPAPMNKVIAAIQKASARGVKIFILVDKLFYKNSPESYEFFKKISGVNLVYFDIKKLTGGINHSKYILVDGESAYIGSANMDWRSIKHIHELGVVTQNPSVVAQLFSVFASDWKAMTHKSLPVDGPKVSAIGDDTLQLFASPMSMLPKGVKPAWPELHRLITSAKTSLDVAVHSYATVGYDKKIWFGLQNDLLQAAERGVKINLLLGSWVLKHGMPADLLLLAKNQNITVKIITVPKYKNQDIPYARVLHSKFMIVDGKTLWLGTSNWARDYFFNSRNIDLVSSEEQLVQPAQKTFDVLWNAKESKFVSLRGM